MALDVQPPPARLRIDLAEVTFMDTTGVAALLKARRRALEVGARFSVSSDLTDDRAAARDHRPRVAAGRRLD